MIKYFCDKCNQELENYDIFTVNVIPPEIRTWEDDTYIFCRACLKEFQKWLKTSPFVKTTNTR